MLCTIITDLSSFLTFFSMSVHICAWICFVVNARSASPSFRAISTSSIRTSPPLAPTSGSRASRSQVRPARPQMGILWISNGRSFFLRTQHGQILAP